MIDHLERPNGMKSLRKLEKRLKKRVAKLQEYGKAGGKDYLLHMEALAFLEMLKDGEAL